MNLPLTPSEDYQHTLAPGEHEAFFFAFTTEDGEIFGTLRLIFGHSSLLEVVALRYAGATWVHQHAGPGAAAPDPDGPLAGPHLMLACAAPWQQWAGLFAHTATSGAQTRPLTLAMGFTATTPPTRYQLGAYQQTAQDGRFHVTLRLGESDWEGDLTGYRDHSWGRRHEGQGAASWRVAVIPQRLYVLAGETAAGPVSFGRTLTPEGDFRPVVRPAITPTEIGWRISDPDAGLSSWDAHRLAPPLVAYLGGPGRETFRDTPEPGDWGRDAFGPALYTSTTGEPIVGFLEEGGAL